ncbi:MAG: ABC transporter permease [Anaerolineae bacterium]|nr:ABC transporter permease [Anaerolineae bacterium]
MKIVAIAVKDMKQSSRTALVWVFMFVVPLGITLLFYFMFGNIAAGDEFELPQTAVVLVNQDRGSLSGGGSMGATVADILQQEAFAELIVVTESADADAARDRVDKGEADVALIIPPDLTDALLQGNGSATVELHKDPTLTIGPALVEGIVSQILDGFAGTTIGTKVTLEQLEAQDVAITAQIAQEVGMAFSADAQTPPEALIALSTPDNQVEQNPLADLLAGILGGMMVFFAFYTGGATQQTILIEEERGTLARLFTTPTPIRTIMGGKSMATLFSLIGQVVILMGAGALVFAIDWGEPLPMLLAAIGLILIAAATGVFLVSMLKNTRQAGTVFGGVLTITGMVGLLPIFMSGAGAPDAVIFASLLVPQGWAMRGLTLSAQGATVTEMLPTFGVLLLWCAVFVAIGLTRMRRRFA